MLWRLQLGKLIFNILYALLGILSTADNLTHMPRIEGKHRVGLEVELFACVGSPGIRCDDGFQEVMALIFIYRFVTVACVWLLDVSKLKGRVFTHDTVVDLRGELWVLKVAVVVVVGGALVLRKARRYLLSLEVVVNQVIALNEFLLLSVVVLGVLHIDQIF